MKTPILTLGLALLCGCAGVSPTRKALVPPPLPKVVKRSARLALTGFVPAASAAPDALVLAQRFGDVADDAGTSIALDAQGNALIAGGISVASGSQHPFVLKRSPTGGILWSNIVAGNMSGTANAVAVDAAGNVFLTGNFFGTADFGPINVPHGSDYDIFVAKLSPAGAWLWVKRFGSAIGDATPTDNGQGISADGNSVIVTGFFNSQDPGFGIPVTPRSGQNAFVLKLSADTGVTDWVWHPNSTANTQAKCVRLGADGRIYAAGCMELQGPNSTFDFGNGPQNVTSNAAWIACWNGDRTLAWSRLAGQWAEVRAMALHGGNVAFAGGYRLTVNWGGSTLTNPPVVTPQGTPIQSGFVADYTQAGVHNWSASLGTQIAAGGIAVDASGRVTASKAQFLYNFDGAGVPRWTNNAIGSAAIGGLAAGQNTFAVGSFRGSLAFGGTNLASQGVGDVFILETGTPPVVGSGPPEPPMSITNIDGQIFVMALQRAGMTLTFYGTERVDEGASWPYTLAVFGSYPDDQPVAIEVPEGKAKLFVKGVNTPPPPTLTATSEHLTDSGKVLSFQGHVWHLWKVGSGKTYRLKP